MTNHGLAAAEAVLTAVLATAVVAVPGAARAAPDDPSWVWPLEPAPAVVAAFDPPDETWGSGHRGVDLLGAAGRPVLAIGTGRVTFSGQLAGRGVVVVRHGGLRSTYEPVLAHVTVGDRVRAGELLGVLQAGRSHCAPGSCLHLGVKRGEIYLDPLGLLTHRQVRLKPLEGGDLSTGPSVRGSAGTTAISAPRSPEPASSLSARAVLGGAAAVTAALLAAERRRRPQARG